MYFLLSWTYSLSNTLLAMSHEQIGNLLDYWIVPVLDMPVFRKRKGRHLELQAWCLWHFWHRLEIYKTHVQIAASTTLCRHRGVCSRAVGCCFRGSRLEFILHDLGQVLLSCLVSLNNLELSITALNRMRTYLTSSIGVPWLRSGPC